MLGRLDRNWWTAFGFFVASVAISSGMTIYRIGVEEQHYRDLFGMIVMNSIARPEPGPAPSQAGEINLDALRGRPLDI